MVLKKMVVSLEFLYDDEKVNDPDTWDWFYMLDIGDDEMLRFVGGMDSEPITEEDTKAWEEYKKEQE